MSEEYKIKIVTTNQGDGAKQTAGEMDKLKTSVDGVNERLEAQAKGEKNAASVTEEFTTKKVNLTKAFKSLSHEIPLVGQALAFLKNPYMAAIALIAAFIIAIHKKISAQKLAMQADAELAESLDPVTVKMSKLRTLAAEAAVAHEAFAKSLTAISDAVPKALENLDDLNKRLKLRRDLAQDIETAEKKRQLGEVELGLAQGSLTPMEAIDRRFAIEGNFDDAARKRKEDAIGIQANIDRQKEFRAADRVREAKAAEPEAEAALIAEKDRLAKMDDDNAANEKLREKRLEEIKKDKVALDLKKTASTFHGSPLIEAQRQEKIQGEYDSLLAAENGIKVGRDAFGASRTLQSGRVSAAEGELNRIRGVATSGETQRLSSQHSADTGIEAQTDQRMANAIIKANEDAARRAERQIKLIEEGNRTAEENARGLEQLLRETINLHIRRTYGDGG